MQASQSRAGRPSTVFTTVAVLALGVQLAMWAGEWARTPAQGLLVLSVPSGATVTAIDQGREIPLGTTPLLLSDGGVLATLSTSFACRLDKDGRSVRSSLTNPGTSGLIVQEFWLPPAWRALAEKVAGAYLPLLLGVVCAAWASRLLLLEKRRREQGEAALGTVTEVAEGGRAGHYRLEKLLGQGAMAEVFRGRDLDPGASRDPVAVKVLFEESSDQGDHSERFEREADICSQQLRHPHIVSVRETGREGGRLYMVMDLVDGVSLARHIQDRGRLSIAESLRIAAELCDALAHAHACGIVHRDLKPDNVLLTSRLEVKVGDFGLARGKHYPTITVAGAAVGTPAYMPPEQACGERADARSDLYSLGCILYEMVVGAPPFEGENALAVIMQHLSEVPLAPSQKRTDVPPDLDAAIMRLLEKEADQRFQSAQELREALRAVRS